jgi:hypothetical protein
MNLVTMVGKKRQDQDKGSAERNDRDSRKPAHGPAPFLTREHRQSGVNGCAKDQARLSSLQGG